MRSSVECVLYTKGSVADPGIPRENIGFFLTCKKKKIYIYSIIINVFLYIHTKRDKHTHIHTHAQIHFCAFSKYHFLSYSLVSCLLLYMVQQQPVWWSPHLQSSCSVVSRGYHCFMMSLDFISLLRQYFPRVHPCCLP